MANPWPDYFGAAENADDAYKQFRFAIHLHAGSLVFATSPKSSNRIKDLYEQVPEELQKKFESTFGIERIQLEDFEAFLYDGTHPALADPGSQISATRWLMNNEVDAHTATMVALHHPRMVDLICKHVYAGEFETLS